MEITAAFVEEAIRKFYQEAHLQQEVHSWLTTAQVSQHAWSFAWDLMHPNKSAEVQFFGASTLHCKIARFWFEVPEEQYVAVREQLLQKLLQFAPGPKIVLTRLCVTVAALVLQTAPQHWPNALPSLIGMFQHSETPSMAALTSEQRCRTLLEILSVVPEEFFRTILPNSRRAALREELTEGCRHVMVLVQGLLTPASPPEVYNAALRTYSSWVEFGIPMNESLGIILQVFKSLENPELEDTATETLVNVFSHPQAFRYPNTVNELLPQVLAQQPAFKRALESSDMDKCQNIARLVVAVAETHSKLWVEGVVGDDQVRRERAICLLKMMLNCSAAPGHFPVDEMFSDSTFCFWYTIQDDIQDLPVEKKPRAMPVFLPIYLELMSCLLVKVQYPPDDQYQQWCTDEKESFRCYRQDIGDTMMYTFNFLGVPLLEWMVGVMYEMLHDEEKTATWQMMEGVIFMFASIAENVGLEENAYMPQVFQLLLEIPLHKSTVLHCTVLNMLGAYGEWLSCHPECLSTTFTLIMKGLQNPESATAATMALKDVSREVRDHIQEYATYILTVSKDILEANVLKTKDALRLVTCVGQVLSAMTFETIMSYLEVILTPHIQQLETLAQSQDAGNMVVRNSILVKLMLLSNLCSTLDIERQPVEGEPEPPPQTGPQPVLVILQKVCPIIEVVLSKYLSDAAITEAVCEIFKKSLRTLADDFAPLARSVGEISVQMYQSVPQAAILDLVRQLLLLFSAEPDFVPVAKLLLKSVVDRSLPLFNIDVVRENGDIVEGFMSLMAQVMRKIKFIITDGSLDLPGVFQAATVAMSVPESTTVKASCASLCEFISIAKEEEIFKNVVATFGCGLTERILRAIGGESPRGVMDFISDVLALLNQYHKVCLNKWLCELIYQPGLPSKRPTKDEKDNFVRSLLRESTNKRKVRNIVKEFSLLCRGLLGTEYAAQAAIHL